MYLSSREIHAANENAIRICHRVSAECLNYADSCFTFGAAFLRRWLLDSASTVQHLDGDGAASNWLIAGGMPSRHLIEQEVPALIANVAHASASCAEQLWISTEDHLSEVKVLADGYYQRWLRASSWDTFWMVEVSRQGVDDGLAAANRFSETAIAAAERMDEEIRRGLAPPRRQGSRRRQA